MTARAKKIIEGLAKLSESELSEVAREFPGLRTVDENSTRRPFRGPDLIRLLGSLRVIVPTSGPNVVGWTDVETVVSRLVSETPKG